MLAGALAPSDRHSRSAGEIGSATRRFAAPRQYGAVGKAVEGLPEHEVIARRWHSALKRGLFWARNQRTSDIPWGMTRVGPIGGRVGNSGNAQPPVLKATALLPAWLKTLLCIYLIAAPFNDALGQHPPERAVLLIEIKGAIGYVTAEQLAKALDQATAQKSPAVVV